MKLLSRRRTLPIIFGWLLVPAGGQGAELRVPADYPTIQAGIDAAEPGDTVLVGPGTYSDYEIRYPDGFRTVACILLKGGVTVRSEDGPEVTMINVAVLPVDESGAGVLGYYLETGPTRFEGFTLLGGDLLGPGLYSLECAELSVVNCRFDRFVFLPAPGAGMLSFGDVAVVNCEFYKCRASEASAIFHSGGTLDLIGCEFRECEGGAVGIYYSEGTSIGANVIDCKFIENRAVNGVGGIGVDPHSGFIMRGCLFLRNVATGNNGGLGAAFINGGPILIEDCEFIENAGPDAGAFWASSSHPTVIRNNTFASNVGTGPGGAGAMLLTVNAELENNIISSCRGGPACKVDYGPAQTNCNVYWDNEFGEGIPLSATDRIIDPKFCNPANDDYSLELGSPCLPQGSLGCGLIGALPQGCGTVAVESKSWGAIKGLYR